MGLPARLSATALARNVFLKRHRAKSTRSKRNHERHEIGERNALTVSSISCVSWSLRPAASTHSLARRAWCEPQVSSAQSLNGEILTERKLDEIKSYPGGSKFVRKSSPELGCGRGT